jgi:hypothetical protein
MTKTKVTENGLLPPDHPVYREGLQLSVTLGSIFTNSCVLDDVTEPHTGQDREATETTPRPITEE